MTQAFIVTKDLVKSLSTENMARLFENKYLLTLEAWLLFEVTHTPICKRMSDPIPTEEGVRLPEILFELVFAAIAETCRQHDKFILAIKPILTGRDTRITLHVATYRLPEEP